MHRESYIRGVLDACDGLDLAAAALRAEGHAPHANALETAAKGLREMAEGFRPAEERIVPAPSRSLRG